VEQLQNFVDGDFRATLDGSTMPIIDPSTAEPYLTAPCSGPRDVDLACQAAGDAFESWKRTNPSQRSLLLFRVADALEAKAEEFIAAESRNTGKPLLWMRNEEFPMVLDHIRFAAAMARSLTGLSDGEYVTGYQSSVRREPVGVCGQVTPWNYPLLMAVWKFGPALAAGNTVVLKPSDTTPVTTVMAAAIMAEHLPPGVFNVVIGDRETGRALVAHPRPDLISVTGSVRAGKEVAAAAASSLKRVHLELGGKAPVLVFADVDLPHAIQGILVAGFINAGQDCAAATRVIVHESIHDEFVAGLVVGANSTKYGPPHENVEYGPLNNATQLERVQGFLDRAPGHARVLAGGSPDRRDGGYYFQPTVVAGLRQDDEMIQNEIFGPVITVQSFSTEQEAVAMANGVAYGLAASIWSTDHATVLRVSGDLDFGQIWVNCHLVQPAEMPNGGFKHSGHGNDLSLFALEDYTRVKQVTSWLSRSAVIVSATL
jgi:betaine-aldehyde dehydrogenase